MLNHEYIGAVSETRTIEVELGQLKLFAKAIGETNPIYFDEDAARAAGHPAVPAPVTFANCLRLLAPEKSPSYEELGIELRGLLHGEEEFEYYGPIYAGDRLCLVTEVIDMFEKKGGALEFVVRDTRISRESGELLVKLRTVLVMRHGSGE